MSERPLTVAVRSNGRTRPRVEVLVTHRPQHTFCISGCTPDPGTGFLVVRINSRRIDAKVFPWPTMEPGDILGIVLVNTTNEDQRLGVKLQGKEIR